MLYGISDRRGDAECEDLATSASGRSSCLKQRSHRSAASRSNSTNPRVQVSFYHFATWCVNSCDENLTESSI